MKKREKRYNTIVTQVAVSVTVGILIIGLVISNIVIYWSKNVFFDIYATSQEKFFSQIEANLNHYNDKLQEIADEAVSGTGHIEDELGISSIVIIGTDGTKDQRTEEVLVKEESEILKNSLTKKAKQDPDSICYGYYENGWTESTKNYPVVIGVKALYKTTKDNIYAYIYFLIEESVIQERFYDQFLTENIDFYIVDSNEIVISGNQKSCLDEKLDESPLLHSMLQSGKKQSTKGTGASQRMVLQGKIASSDIKLIGIIKTQAVLKEVMNERFLTAICLAIAIIGCVLSVWIVKKIMEPLLELTKKMAKVKEGNLNQYMEIETGIEELTNLSIAYNYMLDGLNQYVEKLMKTEEEKRKAEITALQMQINPHYIYNTLTSIKWMIWQGKYDASVRNLDAFVHLLRNTVSNTDEFITVAQEVLNLKDYILINDTRYGDKIRTEFFVSDECELALVPKLIVQPFIENAYFHAFPTDVGGSIQIFINRKGHNLNIAIVDNGIGMDDAQNPLNRDDTAKTREHYSGIGVHNVENRLKLLYGEEYGIDIRSKKGRGTRVNIILPYELKRVKEE
jgi:two-component system sensor histidine kinase YesM